MSNNVAGLDYHVVTCQNCEIDLSFQQGASSKTPAASGDELEITCHACGHSGAYHPAHLRRSQAQYPL
jgi:RNase P subunit RPR2